MRNYVPLLSHMLPHVSSFSQADDCQVSFPSKTEFSSWWDRVLFIKTCVNAAERCISAKRAGIFIRESQNIWGFCLWRERNLHRMRLCFWLWLRLRRYLACICVCERVCDFASASACATAFVALGLDLWHRAGGLAESGSAMVKSSTFKQILKVYLTSCYFNPVG